MSGFNNNGINLNQMGFFGQGQGNNQSVPNPSANIQQIAQALGVNPAQLTPENLAQLQRQAALQIQRQQQQNLQQQQNFIPQQQQSIPQQSSRQAAPNPQLLQQYVAQAQQQQRQQYPQQQQQQQQLPMQHNQQQRQMSSLQSQLPPGLQNALQSVRTDPRQQAVLAQMAQANRPNQQQYPSQPVVPQMQHRNSFNPNMMHQGSSPLMGALPLTPQPLVGTGSPQGYHPSLLSTPPQATNSGRIPSPPRAEGRRTSFTNQTTASNIVKLSQIQIPKPAPIPQPSHSFQQSTGGNSQANPGLASVIPSIPPPTFKLDDSKLRANKAVDRSSTSAPESSSSSNVPSPAKEPTIALPEPPKPALSLPVAAPKPPMRVVPYVAPPPAARPANTLFRNDGRHVDFAGDRKKGAEGMRGSMRNEIARLMYAAGDEPEPDVNAVDYMEDLVVEFMADLCRPLPPMRQAPGQPYQAIPLTSFIVRDRLSSRPALKKYLNRWDTMTYLSGEINRNRREVQSTESFADLVDTVGRNYLEIDTTLPTTSKEKRKYRPRKTAGAGEEGSRREDGEDGNTQKRKPGPKKGWKQSLVGQGPDAVPHRRRPIGGVKKRRKESGAGSVKRETSAAGEGSMGSGTASPMV